MVGTSARGPAPADVLTAVGLALLGLLGPSWSPGLPLPPFLAYLLGAGSWCLLLLAAITLGLSLAGAAAVPRRVASCLTVLESRRETTWVAFGLLVLVAFARVPELRRNLGNIGGDEPKYLRMALSLLNDTDLDVSSGREAAPDLALRLRELRSAARATGHALTDLWRPHPIPADHVWNAGPWSIHGRHGGVYHLQPGGLPALLAVFIGAGRAVWPSRTPAELAATFLVVVWILAAVETHALLREILDSRMASLFWTALLFACAPVFVGGYHLYPESVALFAVPFCYRRTGASAPPLGHGSALVAGALAGGLFWVHPKFVPLSLVLLALGLAHPRPAARARVLLVGSFVLMAGSSLLHVHYLTGLFRPEGLYIREAMEYSGAPNPLSPGFAKGLVNGLLGGLDGIFVLAPVLLLAVSALPAAFARRPRATLELLALFATTWGTAAVHGGISLASPARLFMPVAFALVAILALGAKSVGPRACLLVPLALLLAVSLAVTLRTASHWRFTLNPYRGLFVCGAQDFSRSLPGRNPRKPRGTVPLEGLRSLAVLGAALALGHRWRKDEGPETTPGPEALRLLAVGVMLAFLLDLGGPGPVIDNHLRGP